jgi:hypothetical protein
MHGIPFLVPINCTGCRLKRQFVIDGEDKRGDSPWI